MLIYLITAGEVYDAEGVSRYIRELANYLSSNGFRIKIISRIGRITSISNKNLIASKIDNVNRVDKVDRHKFSKHTSSSLYFRLSHLPNPLTTILGTLVLIRDIINECSSKKIIHVHDVTSSLLIALIASKIFNIPFLVQIHGFPVKEQKIKLSRENSSLNNFLWFLTKVWHDITIRVMKSCAMLLVNNREVKFFYESCGFPSEKLEVIPSALNFNEFEKCLLSKKEAEKCLGLSNLEETVTIGFIGGLRPEKNVEILVKAFGELVKEKPTLKVKLVIIGDGPTKPILEKYVKEYNIDNYTLFLGYIPNAHKFLHIIDIFVLPSLSEGSPIALIEAMACSKAIIASNIPAIKEIVEDGKEALLFDPYSSEQLKEAILKLYHNSELRRAIEENAKKKAKQYDVNIIFSKIVEIYQKVLRIK
jgi:glycosyltransferase involved in cell wall biosynthesis